MEDSEDGKYSINFLTDNNPLLINNRGPRGPLKRRALINSMTIKNNKKKFIITLSITFLLLFLGIFFLLRYSEPPEYKLIEDERWEKIENFKYESVENYTIEETPQGKIIINNNVGLNFAIPKEWHTEKIDIDQYAQEIELSSPDKIISQDGYAFPDKGCVIRISVEHYISKHPEEKRKPDFILSQIGEKIISDFQEIASISNYNALKTIEYKDSDIGEAVLIEVPIKEKLYSFGTLIIPEEKERCWQEFDNFLKTVLIY